MNIVTQLYIVLLRSWVMNKKSHSSSGWVKVVIHTELWIILFYQSWSYLYSSCRFFMEPNQVLTFTPYEYHKKIELLWSRSLCTYYNVTAFIEPPLSFNASEGSSVTFHCRINESGNILFWLIDDEISTSDANRNRSVLIRKESNNIMVSNLIIEAHSWNQNAQIQCAFHSWESGTVNCDDEMVMCSEKAALKIQGDLAWSAIVRLLAMSCTCTRSLRANQRGAYNYRPGGTNNKLLNQWKNTQLSFKC